MSGEKISAIQLISCSVYGVDAAFSMFSEKAGFSVDGKTSGYRDANQPITNKAVESADATNAQPSRSALVSPIAASSETTASTPRISDQVVPRNECCQATETTIRISATTPTDIATDRARARTSWVVFSARYTPPWVRNSASVHSPVTRANGFNRSRKLPTYSCRAFSGTPRTMLPNATPHSSASIQEVIRIAQSQRARHVS